MKNLAIHAVLASIVLLVVIAMVTSWTSSAGSRLEESLSTAKSTEGGAAIAQAADDAYCSTSLRQILRRVLTSCGLVSSDGQQKRGCQPVDAKNVAAMSGPDFNALFKPLAHRAAIIQFDQKVAELDEPARALLEKTFSDQRGASYFLVVSRASPEGTLERNREISEGRAKSVLDHLRVRFNDPDLDQEVGLLWLGEEFAQLEQEYCQWNRSRAAGPCDPAELNRSAFVTWIDCQL